MAPSHVRRCSGLEEVFARCAVDNSEQKRSPVVGEAARNPGTINGDRKMKKKTTNERESALHEVNPSELAGITGGTIWVSDGYCVSPFLPRHLPLAALPEQITVIKDQSVIGPR
jgi:hypothetical protein